MNNKGSLFFGIIIMVMIFASGMLIMNFLIDDVTTATTTMDCNNMSISDGSKVTCLGIDGVIPYFFLLIISAAGGIIAVRLAL